MVKSTVLSWPVHSRRRHLLLALSSGLTVFGSGLKAQSGDGAPPLPGLTGVLSAFERAPIVGLADVHRDEALARFRISLIQRPEFAVPGRDIVIEWGNARYQALLDRYSAGDSVPGDSLQLIWRNAVGNLNGVFDSPMYEQFISEVRKVNQRLGANRRIRLLACDPPIDWERVHSRHDYLQIAGSRDAFCADLLEREILARGRSALLVLGGGHLLRHAVSDAGPGANVSELLSRRHPGSIFAITTRPSRNSSELTRDWPEPSFLALRGTSLGRDDTEYGPLETIADGFLFLRRGRSIDPDPAIYNGTAYRRELDRRWCLIRGRPFDAATSTRTARPTTATCPNP